MSALVDTSLLIDFLRARPEAVDLLQRERAAAPLHASEITRLEILSGMKPGEEAGTGALLGSLVWHPVDAEVAELAGDLGRRWRPSHQAIDGADLAIAATAQLGSHRLLTLNVRHLPMVADLEPPY